MRGRVVILLAIVLASGCAETRPGAEQIGWFTDHRICDGCGGPSTALAPVPPPPLPPSVPQAAPEDLPPGPPGRLRGG